MRFHAQRLPLGGTDGPLHGCRRSRGPRSWSQETRRARWRGFVRGVDMGGPGPTGRPYPTALECRAVDTPTGGARGRARASGAKHKTSSLRSGAGRGRPCGHCSTQDPSLALPVLSPRQAESTWAREIWEAARWLNGGKGGTGVAKWRRERGREDGDGVERRDGESAPTVLER